MNTVCCALLLKTNTPNLKHSNIHAPVTIIQNLTFNVTAKCTKRPHWLLSPDNGVSRGMSAFFTVPCMSRNVSLRKVGYVHDTSFIMIEQYTKHWSKCPWRHPVIRYHYMLRRLLNRRLWQTSWFIHIQTGLVLSEPTAPRQPGFPVKLTNIPSHVVPW